MELELKQEKYLNLLFGTYSSAQAVCRDIIDLNAVLNKPKKTEHGQQEDSGYDCEF